MNKKSQNLVGLILILIIIGLLIYAGIKTLPTKSEIEQAARKLPEVNRDLMSSGAFTELKKYDVNGDVPVKVPSNETGRDDMFVPY
jgi:hypothetical protein